MKQIFIGDDAIQTPLDCMNVDETAKNDLGFNSPATGQPSTATPNSGYVRWISSCMKQYLDRIELQPTEKSRLLSAKTKTFLTSHGGSFYSVQFSSLPDEVKNDIINYSFDVVFGSEDAFNRFGLLNAAGFKAQISERLREKSDITLSDALQIIMINYLLRDEFLSY